LHLTKRLNLSAVDESLRQVEAHWNQIDDDLDRKKIGRKDTPFTAVVRERMMAAYSYLDSLLAQQIVPFSSDGIPEMLQLNLKVHYGNDTALMKEYHLAIKATAEKFRKQIIPVEHWYRQHRMDHPLKIAAEIYVAILGSPQLFIEGNHRTGSLIASWINMCAGYPPFVLSPENAIAYFQPSSEIKHFGNKTTWKGKSRLPKYRKSFRAFWESHIDNKFVLPTFRG